MTRIIPHLWYDDNAEEAINLYVSLFPNSKITSMWRLPGGPGAGNLVADFRLAGQEFKTIDAGDYFKFSPANSLFVSCDSKEEIDRLWAKLSDGGFAMMELGEYPFSERYGWVQDKFGLSWQLILAPGTQKISPALLFVREQAGKAEQAIRLYTSIFGKSGINTIEHYKPGEDPVEGATKFASFTLEGQNFIAMDSGIPAHEFTFTGAFSFYVRCRNQQEIDFLWEKLTDGGEIQQCGWLKDRFGVFWQIVPTALEEIFGEGDPERIKRVIDAFMPMKKLEIEPLLNA